MQDGLPPDISDEELMPLDLAGRFNSDERAHCCSPARAQLPKGAPTPAVQATSMV
jgi:hypothetical protein